MLTPTQAIAKAKSTAHWTVGMCDNFVANMFGFSSSGYATAASHWAAIPTGSKHPGDPNPPAGALVFWGGGSGHVALSTGGGNIVSTDYPRSGMVSATTISAISNGWGKSYLGWSAPVFQGQIGSTSNASFSIPGLPSIPSLGGSVLDFLTGGFGTDIKDMFERAALMLMGITLVLIGLATVQQNRVKVLLGKGADKVKESHKEGVKQAKTTSAEQVEIPEEKEAEAEETADEETGDEEVTE